MSVRITNTAMSSNQSPHTAQLVDGGWELSWLPGRLLDRNQANTAMTIAEIVATEDLHPDSRLWPHIHAWARELGLSGPDAVARASEPPAPSRTEEEDHR